MRREGQILPLFCLFFGKRGDPMESVSVIIPTYRPDQKLRALLERLSTQSLRPEQILLVNTEKDLFDPALLNGMDNVEIVHISRKEFDHGGTRHWASTLTSGEILIYMTMDAVPADNDLIKNLVGAFADPLVVCAYARQLPAKDAGVLERYTRQFNYGEKDLIKEQKDTDRLGIKTYFCSNVCAAYRRDIYEKLGGFPRKTIFNEDMIYAARAVKAGYRIAYRSGARVIHSHNYSGAQQLKRNFDLGVSQAQYAEIFAGVKSESEGMKLVKSEAKWLIRSHEAGALPALVYQSACKLIGYRLGKRYAVLPDWLVRRLSMNPGYWEETL